jgi:hypothetical protein
MYRPNFCSDCGNQIVRTRWRVWTSRKFCDACARRFRRSRIFYPLTAGALLFAVGLLAGRAARPTPPPLIVEHGQLAPISAPLMMATKTSTPEVRAGASNTPLALKPEPAYGADGTSSERPTDPNEVVSICGARTQKGTPCQRRVRGTGRCWQHKGMPAMLPASKLIVQ